MANEPKAAPHELPPDDRPTAARKETGHPRIKKGERQVSQPTRRREIHWAQAIAGAAIGALIGTSLSTGVNVCIRRAESRRDERANALRVVRHAIHELQWNALAVQLKGGIVLGLVTDPPKEKSSLDYQIAMIKATPFQQMLLIVWGQDMKALLSLGEPGQDAHDSLVALYATIKKVESDEANVFSLIEKETDPERQRTLFHQLHEVEDELRKPIAITAERLSRLPRE